MTRAASGAQRSGAAALIIILRAPREYFAHRAEHFATSYFFAPRAPARWQQRKIGARWLQPARPGSVVLVGIGDRTGKHLKYNGSTVLFRSLTRDARADTPTRTRHVNHQNHRTSELNKKTYVSHEVIGSIAVLYSRSAAPTHRAALGKASNRNRLPVLASNKQWGGYHLDAFAASIRPDQGLERATARRNFRPWARRAAGAGWAIDDDVTELGGLRRNGGFPPFFGGALGLVGMAALERSEISVSDQRVAAARRKPARLSAPVAIDPPGVGSASRGGTPPSRVPITLRPLAQPVFGVSSRSQIRCDAASCRMERNGRNAGTPKTGSGVSDFPCALMPGRDRAAMSKLQGGVGENRFSLGRGRSRAATLWGEGQGVN